MKNFAYMANLARTLSGTNEANYSNDELVRDANYIREDIYEKVVSKWKSNPFWDEASIDLIRWETEYPLPSGDDKYYAGMRTVKKVFVKYDENEKYTELEYKDIEGVLTEENGKYYTIADNSIFIFPAPKKYVEDGLVVHGNNTLKEIDITTNEKDMWANNRMPSRATEALALGVAMYYVKYRKRDFTEAEKLEIEYEKEVQKIVATMKARSVRIYENEAIPARYDLQ